MKRLEFGVWILLWGLVAGPAQADEVTFAFTATLTTVADVFDTLPNNIEAGDVVTGRYTFDSDAPPTLSFPNQLIYGGAVCRAQALVEGLELNGELEPGDIASNMGVGDEVDRGQGPQDEYSVQLFSQQDFVFLFIGLVTPGPSNAIVGTGLPLTPPNVTSFTDVDLSISLAPPYEGAQLFGNVTQLTVAGEALPCPEAGTAGALVAVMVLAASQRRRLG